ncbi:heme lyase NrfEFG subunit NrfF [Photobacterium sp. SDRW27]|uniref:heme lyase NrfEFG subunit NrfF n=1 Tax=Photobacterium obscurum TaxID=2829490 RepID=UPI0022445645|nr:heme lyase NrfEFG subunit NrfF [Photobacterium obscurum]MCW8331203.1 heme lyase NrfEFG subunit NrfF [Photobacterium obscurum]
MCLVGVSAAAQNLSGQVFLAADTGVVESVETFQFRFVADQERAIALSRNLRCPQCQNQNLIESNSPVAKDLRLKVYQMVDSGKTDAEVIEYMTSRFGDFVLYKPKFEPKTYFLWGGPVLLLVIFAAIAIYSIRRQEK